MGKGRVFGGGGGMFVRNADKTKYKAYSGEVAGNTFVQKLLKGSPTRGTLVTLGNAGTYPYAADAVALSDSRAFCLLPVYSNSTSTLTAQVCKVDANGTVSYGTRLTLSSAAYSGGNYCATLISKDKVLVCHRDPSLTSYMRWVLCSISGTTISVVSNGSVPLTNGAGYAYRSASIFTLAENKAVLTAAQYNSDSSVGLKSYMVHVNGKSVTFGTPSVVVKPTTSIEADVSSAKLSDTQFIVSYSDRASEDANIETRVCLVDINGETFSGRTPKSIVTHAHSRSVARSHVEALSSNFAIVAYERFSSPSSAQSSGLWINLLKINDGTIAVGTAYAPASGIKSTKGLDGDYENINRPVIAIDSSTALVHACISTYTSGNVLYSRPVLRTSASGLSFGTAVQHDTSIANSAVPVIGICKLDDGRFLALRTTSAGGNWQAAVLAEVCTAVQKSTSQVDGVTVTKCDSSKAGTVLEANYT